MTTRLLRWTVLVALPAALAGCLGVRPATSTAPSPLRSAAAGCWELEIGPRLRRRWPEPARVRLDTAVQGEHLALRLLSAEADSAMRFHFRGWAPLADGRGVYLWIGDGFTGSDARLRVRGNALSGTAATTSDVLELIRHAPVTGRRIACPDELAP
ncbi:hypothetical protein [Longimicrobium terrae]|uniref:Uncharacterized protein n=1 Tax=Longimicrobium terrae TaxID=1639882 RepID=A0A841H575_9BACT|nr:hypothetical protein [Longimicrobium terrae]MBB4638988.1 hypothetical protein [Longimicrobium terrae]MBB6073227.1 hypothetical protein [Longimicrobium terrae]NNC32322.1 hypothetical protein [Longimicrobium terrae]